MRKKNKENDDLKNKNRRETIEEKDNLSDKVKNIAIASLGAFLLTQENLIKLLKELKLPKDAINSIIQTVDKSKEDLIEAFASQFGAVLREVDITKLMKRLISGLTVKVNAEVTLTYKFDEKEKKTKKVKKIKKD